MKENVKKNNKRSNTSSNGTQITTRETAVEKETSVKLEEPVSVTGKEETEEQATTGEETSEKPEEPESAAEKGTAEEQATAGEETSEKPEEPESAAEKGTAEEQATAGEETSEKPEEPESAAEKEETESTGPADGNEADNAAQDGGEETEQDGDNAWEEPEDWEDEEDLQEDTQPAKPWMMALVFLGLIAVAAVICVVLWKSTHADKPGEGSQSMFGENTFLTGTTMPQEPSAAPEPEKTADPDRVVTQDGRTIIFTRCDDMISPKEYVNLRTEPSTAQGDATVSCRLNQGEKAHRTGYSDEMGWSRVEYDDQVLYVVTSYIVVVTDAVE